MTEQLKNKIEKIAEMAEKDQHLLDKLAKASSPEVVTEICKSVGVILTTEEARKGFEIICNAIKENETRELSDEELENVAAASQQKATPVDDCIPGN